MADTFTWVPSYSTDLEKQPRTLEAKFGDGYSQIVVNGINNNPELWNVVFNNRNKTETDLIMAFLDGKNGADYFLWTPPDKGSAIKVICKKYRKSYLRHGLYSISAIFEQVFRYV